MDHNCLKYHNIFITFKTAQNKMNANVDTFHCDWPLKLNVFTGMEKLLSAILITFIRIY